MSTAWSVEGSSVTRASRPCLLRENKDRPGEAGEALSVAYGGAIIFGTGGQRRVREKAM